MDVTPYTPVYLVGIYRHVILRTPVLSLEMSVHALLISSVHVIPRPSFLILPHVCVSVNVLPLASVLMVAVLHVYLLLCPTKYCSESVPRPRDQQQTVSDESKISINNSKGYHCTAQPHNGLNPVQIGQLQNLGHQYGYSGFVFARSPESTVGPEGVPFLK